jgi:propanediol utilization protein
MIKVGVSNHHVHLTKKDLYTLFGEGYELHNKRDLVQIGQFAAEETVTLERDGKTLEHIRIIGPCRNYTQVELLERDNEYFGIKAPIRTSGDLSGSEWINIIGPNGSIKALESTIVADRHIHMSKEDLITFNVHKGQTVKVKYENGVVLGNVHIKSDPTCKLELHMNKDEAERLGIETGMGVKIC